MRHATVAPARTTGESDDRCTRARDDLHAGGDADQVRPRRRRRRRLGAQAPRRDARAAGHRPRRRRDRPSRARPREHRGRGHRGGGLRPRPRRADARLASRRPPTSRATRGSTASSRSAAARASTPRRSPTSSSTHPAPVMDYVNPPVGEGRKPPSPLRPHLAIPTTSGHRRRGDHRRGARHPGPEGQDRDLASLPAPGAGRSSIPSSCARCRPRSPPPPGLDVICHAAESFLSRPYDERERPASPDDRPPYQGANPVADVWSAKALEYGGRYLRRAVADAEDLEARGAMMLAATMAGVGFGSAGVHIPHACAYPIAGLKHAYQPPGYPRRPPVRAARPLGHRHRARGLPLHLRGGARAPPPRRRAARRRAVRRRRAPTRCPTCCARSCATSTRRAASPSSATTRTTCPRSSRARSSSSGCSS